MPESGIRWLPRKRWLLASPLSPGEALARIADALAPPGAATPNVWGRWAHPFEGATAGYCFEMRRVRAAAERGNGWIPPLIVSGAIRDAAVGSRLDIVACMKWPLQAVLVPAALLAFAAYRALGPGQERDALLLLPALGALLFLWALTAVVFALEAGKARSFLIDLLSGSIQPVARGRSRLAS